jgi:hypothetical protein
LVGIHLTRRFDAFGSRNSNITVTVKTAGLCRRRHTIIAFRCRNQLTTRAAAIILPPPKPANNNAYPHETGQN